MSRKISVWTLVCCMVCMCHAARVGVSATSADVGQWTSLFNLAKEKAEIEHRPMLVYWGSASCSYCTALANACTQAEVLEWLQARQIYAVLCKGDFTDDAATCHVFARSGTKLPFVAVYWPKEDGSTLLKKFNGRSGSMPVSRGTLAEQLMRSVDQILVGWNPDGTTTGGEPDSGREDPEGPTSPAPKDNKFARTAFKTALPFCQSSSQACVGVATVSGTSKGKVAVKYQSGKSSRQISINAGNWSVAADGMATARGSAPGGKQILLELSADGVLSGTMKDGDYGSTGLEAVAVDIATTSFAAYQGSYAAALPPMGLEGPIVAAHGVPTMTINLASPVAARKGAAKVALTFPDGKTASISAQVVMGEEGMLLPIVKMSGKNALGTLLAFDVPTGGKANVIHASGTMSAFYNHDESGRDFDFSCSCGVYGSLMNATKIRNLDKRDWSWMYDAAAFGESPNYGALSGVTWSKTMTLTSAGLLKGTGKLSFETKKVQCRFAGVYLPGWEEELGVHVLGALWFTERIERASVVRGFAFGIE